MDFSLTDGSERMKRPPQNPLGQIHSTRLIHHPLEHFNWKGEEISPIGSHKEAEECQEKKLRLYPTSHAQLTALIALYK